MLTPSERIGRRRWTELMLVLMAITFAVLFTSPRVFDAELVSTDTVGPSSTFGRLIRNSVQALGVLAILWIALCNLRARRWRLPRGGRMVFSALLAFPLSLLPSHVLGLRPSFRDLINVVGTSILLVAIYTLPGVRTDWLVRFIRRTLLLFLYGSVIGIALAPAYVLQLDYGQGLFDDLPIRLHGLSFHANALAPIAGVFVLLSWWRPARLRWDMAHLSMGAVVLLLAQSKTTWLGMALAALFIASSALTRQRSPLRIAASVALAFSVVLALLGFELTGAGVASPLIAAFAESETVPTLTGRLPIWGATLIAWQDNVWFGYGPELWGEEMQLEYYPLVGWYFGHAHSFFFQSLGQGGIIAFAGGLTFLSALCAVAWRRRHACSGTVLAVAALLLVRTVSEPAFMNKLAWSPDVVLIALVLTMAARSYSLPLHARVRSRDTVPARSVLRSDRLCWERSADGRAIRVHA